ncbi:MAG TPA: hypothetical protein VFT12_06455, partial [Thermoanaerobaculia bacterium]|nr:hypothetical protein [Thermoanaerobaculia bacterium]
QEEVSGEFLSVVPIYADFGNDILIPIGSLRLVGNSGQDVNVEVPMPQKPRRIVVNALHDILAKD